MSATKSVSVTEEQAKFIEENELSPSDIMQEKINELMGKSGSRLLPTREIITLRNTNFLVTVLGLILIIISLALWSFLSIASFYVPVIIELVGAVVTIYGVYELFRWESILKERAQG